MLDRARDALAGEEAWIVGGAVRDELLARPVVDVDIACRDPESAARRYGRPVFPLSERHGAWRVALDDGRTMDFTPLQNGIEADLSTRDFTINAIAEPLGGGDLVDPFGGVQDLERRVLRAVSPSIFRDDPLRLLRAVRLEDELGFRLDAETEQLLRDHAALVDRPAGERILAELVRLSPQGYERLEELGLLAPLGGKLERLRALVEPSAQMRLVAVFEQQLERLPISNELRRYARTLLRTNPPSDLTPRSVFRFRRETEPWATEAARFADGGEELERAIEDARSRDPAEPLLRGDELGLPPGPEIGRLLALVEEERAAGTISTREEALELVRREVDSGAAASDVTES
jgi:Poly A polymerase head domain/Probable RNA and SrmB- binding site of polymerase A